MEKSTVLGGVVQEFDMAGYDLRTDDGLRAAAKAALAAAEAETGNTWKQRLAGTIRWIREADLRQRSQREFQERLWEENHVAAVGQGNISVDRALDDEGFRQWLAEFSVQKLPGGHEERVTHLSHLYTELQHRLRPFVSRMPHLKILRVIAALYPEVMTTVADRGALEKLSRLLGVAHRVDPISQHLSIRNRIDHVMGPVEQTPEALARRIGLAWLIYDRFGSREPSEQPLAKSHIPNAEITVPGTDALVPLPAVRRRRGLTAIKGLFASVLSTLEFVGNGVSRQELLDFLQAASPEAKASSLGMTINVLQSELDTIRREGDQYFLTPRGAKVLETGSVSPLADWLTTHILGVDKALVELRDGGPLSRADLSEVIRSTNPGLRSAFVPQAMVNWLRSLGVLESTEDQKALQLTDEGREWAARIDWTPESLPRIDVEPPGPVSTPRDIAVPELHSIIRRVQGAGHFPSTLIAQLHAALWAHPRRHFAILTGLSGAGKTLLAREYARAVTGGADDRVLILPVQPGWYDPGAILGYTNPLRGESYVSTDFLEFLLEAVADPERAFVVVLDEMNLSHPEQYMAPLLSGMETGAPIRLHTEGDELDSVPPYVPYPSNLVLIGTINMDETTHGLSDKVLDRAFVLDFWDVDLAEYPRWGRRVLDSGSEMRARQLLEELMAALSPARLHFGWRVVDDVLDFVERSAADGELDIDTALDAVVYGKILPKLRGEDAPNFRQALTASAAVLERFSLPKSRGKLLELQRDLESTGSARFWR